MRILDIFFTFLRLGCTSFGGPVAHLSYFHNEFVIKKKWMSDSVYADLIALCQFLPGPASSQVGMAIGLSRAGISGAIAAWLGFTLPSALFLILCGLGISHWNGAVAEILLHGLKLVAVAVVAQAAWNMGKKLCPDTERKALAIIACLTVGFINSAWAQILVIIFGGFVGVFFLKKSTHLPHVPTQNGLSKKTGAWFFSVFLLILIGLPILRSTTNSPRWVQYFDSFYRAGSLVFGGGHVVLPLLEKEVVPSGWVTKDLFTAGYGLAQAIPGPLFAFSAYLGAVASPEPRGWLGALICLLAAFLPAFLLIVGTLPFWEDFRKIHHIRQAMQGVNAAVVGILFAAFYNPVWASAIFNMKDFAIASLGFALLEYAKFSSWFVTLIVLLVNYALVFI